MIWKLAHKTYFPKLTRLGISLGCLCSCKDFTKLWGYLHFLPYPSSLIRTLYVMMLLLPTSLP